MRKIISLWSAVVLLFGAITTAALAMSPVPAYADAGCGTTSNWHYIGDSASFTLDGNSESFPTSVVAGSDWESTSSAWQVRTQTWGTKDAENYLVSFYTPKSPYMTPTSGVWAVWLGAEPPSGSTLTLQGSICPQTGSQSIGWFSVLLDLVPYVGGSLNNLSNNVQIGNSWVTNTSYNEEVKWTGVTTDRVIPSGATIINGAAEEYYAYDQQFLANANAGYGVVNYGSVQYVTSYEPLQNDYLQAWDSSGSASTLGSIEPY